MLGRIPCVCYNIRPTFGKMCRMARRSKLPPVDFVAHDGQWPHGPFRHDAPVYVLPIAALSARLQSVAAERGLSQRALARETGVNLNTINYIYSGRVIPDTATLATLERALGVDLWPGGLA